MSGHRLFLISLWHTIARESLKNFLTILANSQKVKYNKIKREQFPKATAKSGDEMSNLADEIEKWILRKFTGGQGNMVTLKRNELADELECAPSQISYVLSTRFSVSRGFIVESRRGLGGFIRIARVAAHHSIFADAAGQIDETVTLEELAIMLDHIADHGLLTRRETKLLLEAFVLLFRYAKTEDRVQGIKKLLFTISTI